MLNRSTALALTAIRAAAATAAIMYSGELSATGTWLSRRSLRMPPPRPVSSPSPKTPLRLDGLAPVGGEWLFPGRVADHRRRQARRPQGTPQDLPDRWRPAVARIGGRGPGRWCRATGGGQGDPGRCRRGDSADLAGNGRRRVPPEERPRAVAVWIAVAWGGQGVGPCSVAAWSRPLAGPGSSG